MKSTKSNSYRLNFLKKVKSKYVLHQIFDNLARKKFLEIIRYNKILKKFLNIRKDAYKEEFAKIEIEIFPKEEEDGKFINIPYNYRKYFHIFFDDNIKEIEKYDINENDKISKIKIIIDYKVKTLSGLFFDCKCIEYICFKKFYRNNINNMEGMFWECSSLKELNLSNFNTNNVTNMEGMFSRCSSLKELNISNFNTNNVTNMRYMFDGCSDQFKNKIRAQYKNIKEEAFNNY